MHYMTQESGCLFLAKLFTLKQEDKDEYVESIVKKKTTLCLLGVSQTEGLYVVWRFAITHSDLLISVCCDDVLVVRRQSLGNRVWIKT